MKTLIFLFSCIMLFFSCSKTEVNQIYKEIEYGIYLSGNLAGKQTSARDGDGMYHFFFEFNDRGRGPRLVEKIKINDQDNIAELTINGHNYLKDTILEVFSHSNGNAKWHSSSEQDSVKTDGSKFFISSNGTLGDEELMIRKLLSNAEKSLDLLPSGTVRITSAENIQINDSINLDLIEYVGLGFTPSYIWMSGDQRIFAKVSPWLTFIQAENYPLAEQLLELQQKKELQFLEKIAKDHSESPTGKTIIKNVNLFDSYSGQIIPNQSVVIEGNKIIDVLSASQQHPDASFTIDGSNKTLLPGLFDNHCHVGREDGILHLASGVTAIRDMANSSELPTIRDQFDSFSIIGPRIVLMAGFIDQKGPYAGPGLTISTVEEGFQAIENYKSKGYQQIKLYSSIKPEWVKPLALKAHGLGMKVSGHIPAHMLAEQAIADGYDEIQHVNMLALNFLSDTIDSRTPLRFSAVAANTHSLDLESQAFRKFVSLLKLKKIKVDPTVSIFEGMFTTRAGEPDPQFAEILERLPVQIQRGFYGGGLPIPPGKEKHYQASFEKLLAIIYELYKEGITILPGTDAMPGFALHKELENYVRAGIPASEVIKMATILSARSAGLEDHLGSITPGKLADLILIDGNPVENISDIRRVELTVKDGKILKPKALLESIGIKYFKD